MAAASAATADEGADSSLDLLARQEAIFEALTKDPSNLELMFAYAAVAMRREDYEAAIAVLERMLFFNPDLPRVKLELAVAYYRLGVYDVARFHFDDVLAGEPPDEVAERIAPFLAEIQRRTAVNRFDGAVSIGGVYSSNATLGPLDDRLRFVGGPLDVDPDSAAAPDFGLRVTATGSHRYDLQTPRDDAWITTGSFLGLRYRRETEGNVDALKVSTGPRLALDAEAFGLKARPYAEGGFVRSGDAPLYVLGGVGVEAFETIDPEITLYGGASIQWRDFVEASDAFDGVYAAMSAGVAYAADPATTLRFGATARTDRAAEAFASNVEIGLMSSVQHRIDLAPGSTLAARLSGSPEAFAFAQASHRSFDAPDDVVDPSTTRRDFDLRFGAGVSAPVAESAALELEVSHFERLSTIENARLRNVEVALSLRLAF